MFFKKQAIVNLQRIKAIGTVSERKFLKMYNIFEETLLLPSDVCTLRLLQNKDLLKNFIFLVKIAFYSVKSTNNIMLIDSGLGHLKLVTSDKKGE